MNARIMTPSFRRLFVAASIVVAAGLIALVGFVKLRASRAAETGKPADVRDVPHLEGKWIRFSPAFAERSGVSVATVSVAALEPVIAVTGTATFDPEAVAAVGARIAGRVKRVHKVPGDAVAAGDVLAELESAELGEAQAGLLSARAHAAAETANEAREKQLADARVSAQRDYEIARASAEAARAAVHAAEQRVRALAGDAPPRDIGVLSLTSPIAGKIVESHIARGQSVEPSFTAFKVADLRSLWIELAVFERELGHVHRGDAVDLAPQTNAAATLRGKVAHVGDVIDLETRSAAVRVRIDNTEEKLRPGQSVSARIHTATAPSALVLPHEAITTVDGKPTVFVSREDTLVEPRAVTVGARDGERVEIKSGLVGGERVVVKGVFALKSEVFR